MKKIFVLLLLSVTAYGWAAKRVSLEEVLSNGQVGKRYLLADEKIEIEKFPKTLEQFVAFRDEVANNPKGAVAVMLAAMKLYAEDENLGIRVFTIALDRSALMRAVSPPNYKNFIPDNQAMYFIRRIAVHPYLFAIYVAGTQAKNAYQLPKEGPYEVYFNQATLRAKDEITLYVLTSSGNRPRPITLKKNNRGVWKAKDFSGFFVGAMKLPPVQVDDDL